MSGFISLVGAGPGDPGLLTVRGLRAIQRADVVLYDRLASPALLACVEVPGQERIHVGKTAGPGCSAQEDINRLIIRRGQDGQRVVRLKGGTPFLLGRGGEEAAACAEAGLPFEIIPGVSAVSAVPAYAGIPVTHRDDASALHVATGHERADGEEPGRVRWSGVAQAGGTVVVLMGVLQLERWTRDLLAGGLDPETPAALIRWGTTPRQQTLVATLGTLASRAQRQGLRPPAVAVIGQVVERRRELGWFDERPLHGAVLGVTRQSLEHGGDFEALEALGATLVHIPLVRQVIKEDGALAAALESRGSDTGFTDVVLTSSNGVRALVAGLKEAGLDARCLAGRELWAVGSATARTMAESLCVQADHVPARSSAAGLVELAAEVGVENRRFLFPAAETALPTLREGLEALGAEICQVASYVTVDAPSTSTRLETAFEQGLSMVALASPSAVASLTRALDSLGRSRDSIPVAVIGPTTGESARQSGLRVEVTATVASMAGVAEAIRHHLLGETAGNTTS